MTIKFLPDEWLDELIPPPQEDPTAFIRKIGEAFYLVPDDDDDDDYIARMKIPVSDGVVISFSETESFGYFNMTLEENGGITTDNVVNEKANCFQSMDAPWDVATNLKELADMLEMVPGDRTQVHAYRWDDGPMFVFRNDGEASPEMVRLM